jgi:hypothetical protein
LVEPTGVPKENNLQTLSHNVVSSTPCYEEGVNARDKNKIGHKTQNKDKQNKNTT